MNSFSAWAFQKISDSVTLVGDFGLISGQLADCVACNAQVTSGATNDLKQATRMAQHMVADCGMSEDVGPMHVDTMMERNHGAGSALRQRVDAEVGAPPARHAITSIDTI
eukprot:scaffold271067_cov28-Prasinocladus_malaysianus.AAC.1